MNNSYSKHLPMKPISMKMKTSYYGGWLISYRGMIYSVPAETSRKALYIFKKERGLI